MAGAEPATEAPIAAGTPPRRRWLRAAESAAQSTPALAVLVALVTWQTLNITPGFGLDSSWNVALQMATHRGLDWGTQIVFSYGPLGFLSYPMPIYGGLAALATVYVVALRIGLAAAFLWAARRRGLPLVVAFAVALVASTLATPEASVPIAFICCALAIGEDPPPIAARLVVYGGGAVAALESMVKLNSGAAVLAMVVVAVVALPGDRRSNLGRLAATFVATFAVLWFAAGQGVGNLYDYVRTSLDVVFGYSAAMVYEGASQWTTIVGLVLIAATLAASALATRGLPRGRRAGVIALVALLCLAGWKEGFVRHTTGGHMATFFFYLLAAWVAVVLGRSARDRVMGLAGFLAVAALYYAANGYVVADSVHPISSAKSAVTQVHDLLSPSRRRELRDASRFGTALAYGLDQRTLGLIGGRPIDIYPWEASLAWAYGLNWDPLPVFQSYTAYTPALDHLDAAAVESANGPRLILRHAVSGASIEDPAELTAVRPLSIDGRYGPWDEPATTLAMLCHFRALRTTDRYQLLTRTADRCDAPHELGSVGASYNDVVRVPRPPAPHEIVFARVDGLGPSLIERLRTFLYKAAIRYVIFDGRSVYRIIGANAGDGLILSAPPRADFPGPWALAPNPRTIQFEKEPAFATPPNGLRIDFYAMRVRAPR